MTDAMDREDAESIGIAFMEHLPDDAQWLQSPVECFVALQTRAGELEREVAALREALEFVKRDLEDCDWSCTRCGKDYGMKDTDIYLEVGRALKPHAQGTAQP